MLAKNLNTLTVGLYLEFWGNLHREWVRACFKKNSSLHISIAKTGLQFLNDHFYQKILIYPAKFPKDLFAFHHCTFRFITAHFVHHCTLNQALGWATTIDNVTNAVIGSSANSLLTNYLGQLVLLSIWTALAGVLMSSDSSNLQYNTGSVALGTIRYSFDR